VYGVPAQSASVDVSGVLTLEIVVEGLFGGTFTYYKTDIVNPILSK